MKSKLRRLAVLALFLIAVVLLAWPWAWLRLEERRERTWTTSTMTFGSQFKLTSSVPYAMSFNSSRTLQFYIESGKGLQALKRLESGRISLRGVVAAPGFTVKALEPDVQPVMARNVWTFVVIPEREGEQQFLFEVRPELLDGVNDAQVSLFEKWADIISEADTKAQQKLKSYPEHETIDVVKPLLSLENMAQLIGVICAVAGTVAATMPRFKKTE